MPHYTMVQTGRACPVEYEGEVDGAAFYFRARGQRWSFSVGPDIEAAVEVAVGLRGGFHREEPWGVEKYDAGWMDTAVAEVIIARCIAEYSLGKLAWRCAANTWHHIRQEWAAIKREIGRGE